MTHEVTQADREALVEQFVDAGFAKVSRNPSDWESANAWRDAVSMALDYRIAHEAPLLAENKALRARVVELAKWSAPTSETHSYQATGYADGWSACERMWKAKARAALKQEPGT